jgi:hypothetical protein
MDDTQLKIGASVQTGAVETGMQTISSTVERATKMMSSAFSSAYNSARTSLEGIATTAKHAATEVGEASREMSARMIETAEASKLSANGIGNAFGGISSLLGAGLAAGFFAEFIHGAMEAVIQVRNLSEATGATTEEISGLQFAAKMTDVSNETLEVGLRKLARTMDNARIAGSEQSQVFKRLGIDTSEWKDKLPSTTEELLEVAEKLSHMKNGAEKTAIAIELFGRSGSKLIPLLNQGKEGIRGMVEEAKDLGDVVTNETVKSVTQFDESVKTLGAGLKGIFYPILTAILEGLKKLATGFLMGRFTIMAFGDLVVMVFRDLDDSIGTTAQALWQFAHGNFKGAMDTVKLGVSMMKDNWDTATDKMTERAAAVTATVEKMFAGTGKGMKLGGGEDDAPGKTGKTKDDLFAKFEDQLNRMKLEDKEYKTDEIKRDLEFWQQKLKIVADNSEAAKKIRAKVVQLQDAENKDQLRKDLAALQLQLESTEKASDQRVAIAKQEAERIKKEYGATSAEYLAAQRHTVEIEREVADAKKAIREKAQDEEIKLGEIAIAKEEEQKMGAVERDKIRLDAINRLNKASTNDRLKTEQEYENRSYQIKQNALSKKAALLEKMAAADPANPKYKEQLQKLYADIEKAQIAHDNKSLQITTQTTTKTRQLFDATFGAMSRAFTGTVNGILEGTKTISQGIADMGKAMVTSFVGALLDMFMAFIEKKLAMLIFGKAIDHSAAASGIAASAAQGGAAAGASVAAIPITGWAMAPAVAASTYGMLMGYQGMALASAAGGWDNVPHDQIAQLHEKEMVLPGDLAEKVRGMTGAPSVTYSPIIQALDKRGIRDVLRNNRRDVAHVVRGMFRDRVFAK